VSPPAAVVPRSQAFTIANPKRIDKGALIGSFDLTLPSGLRIIGVMLFEKDCKRWIGFPSKEWTREDGTKGYYPLLEFADQGTRDRFQIRVLPLAVRALIDEARQ
jgi:hypothetical protein